MKRLIIFITIGLACQKERPEAQPQTNDQASIAAQGQKRKPTLVGVILYGQCNYKGWHTAPLGAGQYTTAQLRALGMHDNDASSIQAPDDWAVVLYDADSGWLTQEQGGYAGVTNDKYRYFGLPWGGGPGATRSSIECLSDQSLFMVSYPIPPDYHQDTLYKGFDNRVSSVWIVPR